MGQKTSPMSRQHARRVHKFPCDGIARFKINGDPCKAGRTYSEAYEDIFDVTGGSKDDKGHRTFSREGMKRVIALNDRYTRIAHKFIIETMKREAEEKKKAAAEKAATPTT